MKQDNSTNSTRKRVINYEGGLACTSTAAPGDGGGGLEFVLEPGDAGPREKGPPSGRSCTVVGQRTESTRSNSKRACAAPASALMDAARDMGRPNARPEPLCRGMCGSAAPAFVMSRGAGGLDGLVAGCGMALCGATQVRANQRPPPMPLISRCMMAHLRAGPRLGSMGCVGA